MQSNGASATAFVWHLLYFVPALLYGTKEKGVIERPSGKWRCLCWLSKICIIVLRGYEWKKLLLLIYLY